MKCVIAFGIMQISSSEPAMKPFDLCVRIKSVKVRRCTFSCVPVHLSDRTVGAVLSSLAKFGTSDFGAPIHTHTQTPPYTHTRLHTDSRQHALTHTLMHRRTLSRTQNASLGIPVGPGGREEADGDNGQDICHAWLHSVHSQWREGTGE